MKSFKGQFLLAAQSLGDPNFRKTVVLIVQHDQGGALGLVVNRPLGLSVREALPDPDAVGCVVTDPLYRGGPCGEAPFVLHADGARAQIDVCPGVFFSSEDEVVASLLAQSDLRAKFFVGYAGWTAGQLEAELAEQAWLLSPASADDIYRHDVTADGVDLWSRLTRKALLSRYVDPRLIPDDPRTN